MSRLYDFLVDEIFIAFLQQSPPLLKAVEGFKGDLRITNSHLVFTLPALFEFTSHQFDKTHQQQIARNRSDYVAFRKQLYSNPTNTRLQQYGGTVVVDVSKSSLDHSTYKLMYL